MFESNYIDHPVQPHVVFFVDGLETVDMERFVPAIQNNSLFPESVNVGATQITDDHKMCLSVYERPGILTSACGSGACVALYSTIVRGLIKSKK